MSMSSIDKADLLRFISYSRSNSNAYLDTISNSALIAFLQFEQMHGRMQSQPKTIYAIDIFLDFIIGVAISEGGGKLVKHIVGNMVSRIITSRMVIGNFLNTVPIGQLSPTIKLYKGVNRRPNFSKYSSYLKAQRLEHSNIEYIQYGANLVYKKVLTPKVNEVVFDKAKKNSKKKYRLSKTVSIIESAMAYAVNQKVLNNTLFDELENLIRLDLIEDKNIFDEVKKGLSQLHLPLYGENKIIPLDNAREELILYFELSLWGIVFNQKYGREMISLESTGENARLVLFGDPGKDRTLTEYLVNRFGDARSLYKYSERIYSRADYLRKRLMSFGKKASKLKGDFGSFEL